MTEAPPKWPDVAFEVSRDAAVDLGTEGEPRIVSVVQSGAAAVKAETVIGGRLARAVSVTAPGMAHEPDKVLIDLGRDQLIATLATLASST